MHTYGPPWYAKLEQALAPSWPAMILLAMFIIGGTIALILWGDPAIFAAWLIYLLLP